MKGWTMAELTPVAGRFKKRLGGPDWDLSDRE
jgi:hypothetical protein